MDFVLDQRRREVGLTHRVSQASGSKPIMKTRNDGSGATESTKLAKKKSGHARLRSVGQSVGLAAAHSSLPL